MNQLRDTFGREHSYLRISVTERCNLRCVYCMPAEGITLKEHAEILRFEEIERLARIFVEMGVNKIRLTGGEPLVRKDLPKLVEKLAGISGIDTIAMTTNGVAFWKFAEELKSAGLTNVNLSLDTLQAERFEKIALRGYFDDVMKSIGTALDCGFTPLKINTVVMRSVNDDEILDFVEFAKNKPVNVRFIEYMPFKSNGWNDAGFVPYREMKEKIETRFPLVPLEPETAHEVGKNFAIQGHTGTVSFITSMSDDFCDSCNRLRLTADGSIKVCLFQNAEISLRDAMRSGATDEELRELLQTAVRGKQERHAGMQELVSIENRSMIEIGG